MCEPVGRMRCVPPGSFRAIVFAMMMQSLLPGDCETIVVQSLSVSIVIGAMSLVGALARQTWMRPVP